MNFLTDKTNIKTTFIICGDEDKIDLDDITRKLGLNPSDTASKADLIRVTNSGKEIRAVDSYWEYSIERSIELDLDIQIEKLLDIMECKSDLLNELKVNYNLSYKINVVVEIIDNSVPSLGLCERSIKFLNAIHAEISIDLYILGVE